MGVILWYQINFPDLNLKVSSDVYSGDYLVDAKIKITYALGEAGKFDVTFTDLPLKVHDALTDALTSKAGVTTGVKTIIRLGYLDDIGARDTVLTGRVESVVASTRYPPRGALLTGHENAAFALLNAVNLYDEKAEPEVAHVSESKPLTPAAVAALIVDKASKTAKAKAAGISVTMGGTPTPTKPSKPSYSYTRKNAFELLTSIAADFQAEVLVQDGQVLFGTNVVYPPESPIPQIPNVPAILALITGEDSLIAIKGMEASRLAEFKPLQIGASKSRLTTDKPPSEESVRAFDFTVLGSPKLRAGQLVACSVKGYENPLVGYRILQLTHSYSVVDGYVCTGRAVDYLKAEPTEGSASNRSRSEQAREASAASVADRIAGKIQDSQASTPSVDVGKVKAITSADRTASLYYRQPKNNGMSSPSVDLDVPEEKSILADKPIVSPFAWHKVGLSVPVYAGMRALLNDVRDLRDDSVVTGFLWANEPKMDRPAAKDGDWWLCLPTELTTGSPKLPTGKGVNDLTAGDGRRVIEAVGLSVLVGKDSCSAVGSRPTEGDADVFLVTHKSGTTIKIASDGAVTVDGNGKDVVLKSGGVTLTVGSGKVAIS